MMNSDDAAAAAAAVGAASGAELVGEEQEPSEEEVQPETRLKRQKLVEWRASYEKDSIKEYLIAGMVNNKNEPDEAGRNSMGKFQHALAELGLNKDSPPKFSEFHTWFLMMISNVLNHWCSRLRCQLVMMIGGET